MGHLAEIVKQAIVGYAGSGTHTKLYAIADDPAQIYSVNVIDTSPEKRPARVVVMARIEQDKVIIDADTTDRPLVKRLVEAGIPRDHIILAYRGEHQPETESHNL